MSQKLFRVIILCFLSSSYSLVAIAATDNVDPLEPFNRKMFNFNKFIDKILLRPMTVVYVKATPRVVKNAVNNIISNVNETRNIFNDILQLKFNYAVNDSLRLVINTVAGAGGIYDIASGSGLVKHDNISFGKTLSYWGYKNSIYLVVPFRGPCTVRDAIGFAGDIFTSWETYWDTNDSIDNLSSNFVNTQKMDEWNSSYSTSPSKDSMKTLVLAAKTITKRASLLGLESTLNNASVTFDEYQMLRNAYLQSVSTDKSAAENASQQDLDDFYNSK